jgi:putative FmdB family regulatory protein
MPLYEYLCKKCGHRFEKIQKFSDRMIKKCPDCGGVVEQVISAPAVQFKGSGWYVTDYPKKSQESSSSDSAEGGKASKEGKEGKKDEKAKGESGASSASSSTSSSKESKESASKKSEKRK